MRNLGLAGHLAGAVPVAARRRSRPRRVSKKTTPAWLCPCTCTASPVQSSVHPSSLPALSLAGTGTSPTARASARKCGAWAWWGSTPSWRLERASRTSQVRGLCAQSLVPTPGFTAMTSRMRSGQRGKPLGQGAVHHRQLPLCTCSRAEVCVLMPAAADAPPLLMPASPCPCSLPAAHAPRLHAGQLRVLLQGGGLC